MARVLITGASGLIGRRVVEALDAAEGIEVMPVGSADIDLRATGSWDRLLADRHPDAVVHLAWSASGTPGYREHPDNARWAASTIAAASAAAERGIRFVATGTSVDDAPAADLYSRSKADVRAALADRIEAGQIAWLRPYYVFDEREPSPAVLRAALAARSAGQPVGLSSPDARHDFVHARDVGTAVLAVVAHGLAGAIDIGSGEVATVAQLVEAHRCAWVAQGVPSSAAASETAADVAVLRAAGWAPTVTDERLGRA